MANYGHTSEAHYEDKFEFPLDEEFENKCVEIRHKELEAVSKEDESKFGPRLKP
jgi:hypothetical protein